MSYNSGRFEQSTEMFKQVEQAAKMIEDKIYEDADLDVIQGIHDEILVKPKRGDNGE